MPDFLLIGAMKSGSTSLHDHIERHPDVFAPENKEPGFFSRDERFARGLAWYQGLFAGAKSNQLCYESSTCYSRWPHFGDVVSRIHEHVPDAKLLYIMRHPVSRAYSHYKHEMAERDYKKSGPIISFEEALAESEEYVDASLYLKQIEQFLKYYPRERFCFVLLDDLKRDPQATLKIVQQFLGLDVRDDLTEAGMSNPIEHRIAQSKAMQSFDQMRKNPVAGAVARLTPTWVKAKVRELYTKSSLADVLMRGKAQAFSEKLSSLAPATRERLLDRFKQPNRELGEFLGREIPSSWFE